MINCPNCGAQARATSRFCPECGQGLMVTTQRLARPAESLHRENLRQGQVLKERYRVVGPLGVGGLGQTYRAWDITLQIPCAVRLDLSPLEVETTKEFSRQVSLVARLNHPGIPFIWDQFTVSELGYCLVMTLIEGKNLQAIQEFTQRSLPVEQALPWMLQVCDVLIYMHSLTPPVLHRNIKPRHIYIPQERLQNHVMLAGVNIVAQKGKPLTALAKAITPGYSPPEQYGGIEDERVDVYGVGATLFYLLSNQKPPDSIQLKVNNLPFPRLRDLNPELSQELEAVVHQALELDPEKRFPDIAALREALQSCLPEGVSPQAEVELSPEQKEVDSALYLVSDEMRKDSLKRQLNVLESNLLKLEEKRAEFIDQRSVPPDLDTNIQLTEQYIERIKTRLAQLGIGRRQASDQPGVS